MCSRTEYSLILKLNINKSWILTFTGPSVSPKWPGTTSRTYGRESSPCPRAHFSYRSRLIFKIWSTSSAWILWPDCYIQVESLLGAIETEVFKGQPEVNKIAALRLVSVILMSQIAWIPCINITGSALKSLQNTALLNLRESKFVSLLPTITWKCWWFFCSGWIPFTCHLSSSDGPLRIRVGVSWNFPPIITQNFKINHNDEKSWTCHHLKSPPPKMAESTPAIRGKYWNYPFQAMAGSGISIFF